MTQNPFGQGQGQAQGQTHQNMQTGNISQQMNHGGHEVFDVHEVLSTVLSGLNLKTILRPHVKDQELLNILDRQYAFALDEYNITVECFKTGQDPSHPTTSYKMQQGNDFVYGTKPSQPKKPMQNANEINDEMISGYLLGAAKAAATIKTGAALETTNPVVRRVLADSIPNCIEMAYELSIYQNKHHYYQVPQLDQQSMQAMLNAYAPVQGKMMS
ncbi:spore coat protein [Psychrobacillus sp. FJAT-21963]|uniref:spore coat protein n=1 Tax=Psychrobacillus sp. FJAT-21963 TaxID=1712028 RepID=UPI0006F538AE|nr:spore coat protein [Psychrobacillus sp. FJAT-21963]KQL35759.1 spore gernimation protein GerQ [Psychrobacillus sp. FJAT-21963]